MRILLLATVASILVGCVETDLGTVPLLCHRGEPRCPSGYECRPHASLGEVCVKEGAQIPDLYVPSPDEAGVDFREASAPDLSVEGGVDAGLDGPVPDVTTPDGPLLDGPLLDAKSLDGPLLDAKSLDGPLPDAKSPDGALLDAKSPDGPLPDATTTDQSTQPDQAGADLASTADAGCGGGGSWAVSAGGANLDYAQHMAVDSSGNSFITGFFSGAADFGSYKLTSAGSNDIFVAKVSPAGAVLWAVSAGGTSSDTGTGIAVDAKGNSYITGGFTGTAKFGGVTLTTLGTNDIFVAKLDSAGKFLWALFTQGTTKDMSPRIAVDSTGQAHITGYVTGKVAASGANFIWTDYLAGAPTAITLDSTGNSIIAGGFTGTAKFGATTLSAASAGDVFVAWLGTNGAATQAVQAKGQAGGAASVGALAINAGGNLALAGGFYGTHGFGGTSLTSTGSGQKDDVFVTSLDNTGKFLWAASGGGADLDTATGVAIDGTNRVHVAGSFTGNASFGVTTLVGKSAGKSDIFWARLGATGKYQLVWRAGGNDTDAVTSLGLDSAGYTYLLGVFKGSAQLGVKTLSSKGNMDLFLGRLDLCGKF